MNLMSRLKQLEKDMSVNDDDIYIHVGDPCFTLYGVEARAYVAKEQASGRLLNPAGDYFAGNYHIRVHRPDELEG